MTKPKKHPRKQYVVNKTLQWRIAWQAIATWVVGGSVALVFPVLALFLCGMGFAGMTFGEVLNDVAKAYTFPLLMAVVFMPIAIWHSLQFSNRIAGPMYRFDNEIKRLLAGETIKPVKLREKDYWQSFATDFNQIAERLGQLEESSDDKKSDKKTTEKELVNA